ncbi:MAG: hypothetical protein ACI30S_04170 [Muribaculaceae bacterium]
MSNLKSGVILDPNENLVMELEAELWATSSNPIARLFGAINKIINLILGNRRHGYLVITDKRVIEVSQDRVCWIFNARKDVKYVLPSSVKEAGYLKEATFCGCFCQAYHFYYESWTQSTSILLKGVNESGAKQILDAFYNALCANQK